MRKLCQQKGVEIIEARACPDHIHMLISIPPKYSVSQIIGYLKGKSSLMIFDRHANLKYTFATNALEHGMDIKTLSAIIGHVSSATTLNVYAHVTDEMRQKAADRIDWGIAGVEPPTKLERQKRPKATDFQAVKGKYRKPGTGCMTKINDHLWEGRYSPRVNGKRFARNVYAPTEEECERKLEKLIAGMKKELAALKANQKAV